MKKTGVDLDNIQGDDGQDEADQIRILRREVSGLDKKNAELIKEIAELRARDIDPSEKRRVAELAGRLAERERDISIREKAVELAAQKNISPRVALKLARDESGQENLEALLGEYEGMADSIRDGIYDELLVNRDKVGDSSKLGKSLHYSGKSGLTLKQIGEMSREELRGIPGDILGAALKAQVDRGEE